MRDRADDELDSLLDAALETYVLVEYEDEAVAGVKSRTMAAVRAQVLLEKKSGRRIAWPLWALPVAAVLVMAAVLLLSRQRVDVKGLAMSAPEKVSDRHETRAASPGAMQAQVEFPQASHPAIRHVSLQTERIANPVSEPLPKLDVFPTPTPLSPEEQALAAMAQRNPQQAQQAMTMPEHKPIEPLNVKPVMIAAIRIPPLNPSDTDENK
ncbi:hypothetical protein [Silvibacterium dinghuense]|uniref:Uncharacterized protein n=1 Tax=Silvibacterium dinghuense TaxID=1560006 RepID=A0A4Q1SBM0_9BACT|nr:hypothetical protein [Silvibacterium dinghuense]RXS94393.1 hypothetical protein ESZ00_15050 [Silvibacterium dinghuense]GGH16406.1 hypothetical protein GCM10011586_38210 [Silvibacterium dinghuense]